MDPEAKQLLRWENPFPHPGTDLSYGHNLIWPPLAALIAAPFTLFGSGRGEWVDGVRRARLLHGSLRLVGVRDWRVYGVLALWPQVIGEIRVSHLTPFLCLLLALAWRYRDARAPPGLPWGTATAIKFFLWPLGIWLAAIGRAREMLLAGGIALASLLLVIPLTSSDDYFPSVARARTDVRRGQLLPVRFAHTAPPLPETPARIVTVALGALLLLGCWRRASFGLAVAAALVLSPIVWLDYYAVPAPWPSVAHSCLRRLVRTAP